MALCLLLGTCGCEGCRASQPLLSGLVWQVILGEKLNLFSCEGFF